ncbi:hormogonium polysaccharide secretion pseudopilin HpsC [Microcoleus sp. herbarium7]|uniref:hormogonium polysaccharide secretion pseudopilin HpsC n=1 Tax=Microcoleus sp. herbarium7 TaxID=3055435 RepID=UPI002FD12C46
MKTLLRLLLKSQQQQNRSGSAQTEKGVTLIELLIGTVMAFLIITPMLAFVVDMLNTDRREQVKSNTEQDIQAAVDFIAQDLSQAIYIYDNNSTTGIPAIQAQLPPATEGTPILVFWKRQLQKNALPVTPTASNTPAPKNCVPNATPGTATECNDTYVLSLVAYYQVNDNKATWCQPSGNPCPTRIARYQIRAGIKDPKAADPVNQPYYTDVKEGQEPSDGYDPNFKISEPTKNVTLGADRWDTPDVLVNYIDHSTTAPPFAGTECKTALGNPTTQVGTETKVIEEITLKTGSKSSFYACVDTEKNLARVTIRGNSLRRLQANGADYADNKSAFFPTATVQVQGLGARGN